MRNRHEASKETDVLAILRFVEFHVATEMKSNLKI